MNVGTGGSPGHGWSSVSIAEELFRAVAHASGNIDEDLPDLLQVVAECLGFEVATMWWWKPDEKVLRCEQVWQAPSCDCSAFLELAHRSDLKPGEPIPGVVFGEGEPIWVPDIGSYPNVRRGAAASQAGLKSGVAFPIRARGETVGVFELFTVERRPLDAPLLDAVAVAAAHLGDFIKRLNDHAERDRLLEEFAVMHRRQQFLLEANQALSTSKGLDATIDRLAKVAAPSIGDLCLIDVLSSDGTIERLTAYHADDGLRPLADELLMFPPQADGDHPAAIAIRTGKSNFSREMLDPFLASTTRDSRHYEITRKLRFTSYISAPLLSDGHAIGALTVVSSGSGRRFGCEELRLLEDLAAQVASVIERERRFDEQHQVAHILQRSMLPEVTSSDGLTVCARYIARGQSTEVGGDFYDVVDLDSSTVALVIGDVQGHDLTAITTMGKVRNGLQAFLQVTRNLDEVLRSLDRFLAKQPDGLFATLALACLDITTGKLEVALAGHPPPLVVGEHVAEISCDPGPPIGIDTGSTRFRYDIAHVELPAGAGIFFYTDGLVETRSGGPNAKLPMLINALHDYGQPSLEDACDRIIDDTLGGDPPIDDIAVLWAVRTGRTP